DHTCFRVVGARPRLGTFGGFGAYAWFRWWPWQAELSGAVRGLFVRAGRRGDHARFLSDCQTHCAAGGPEDFRSRDQMEEIRKMAMHRHGHPLRPLSLPIQSPANLSLVRRPLAVSGKG